MLVCTLISTKSLNKYNNFVGEVSDFAGISDSGLQDGTGTAARFYEPYGMCLYDDCLYVCDKKNNMIRKKVNIVVCLKINVFVNR